MGYENATICINGHVMSSSYSNVQPFCSKCGKPTISECTHCGSPLHGMRETPGVVYLGAKYHKDLYCYNCGNPYPWTESIINSAVEILSLDEELSKENIDILKNAIPDLLVDTPQTPVATARYKRFLDKTQNFIKNSLYQLFVDVLSDTVKKSLFPQDPQ